MMLSLIFAVIFCNLLHFHGFNSLSVHGVSTSSSPEAAEGPLAPALYVFGDSLLDSGNNNFLPTLAKANYLPYGYDFVSGPTGRYTNGKTVADFIAEYLGLPYPPPYVHVPNPTWLTGFNYASGSCGFLPGTGHLLGKCLNFDDQIKLFQHTIKGVLARSLGISKNLADAIFIFAIGNNDYINNYFDTATSDTSEQYTPTEFSQLLLDEYAKGLKRLYNLGARKFVVFELGPIGCIPSIAKKLKDKKGPCDEEKNKIISHFNNGLEPMLKRLRSGLTGSFFVHAYVNGLGYDAAVNPSKYGLTDSENPCCVTWFNGTLSCIPGLTPCSNHDQHYFWDAYHLTQVMYSLISSSCIYNSSICAPLSIQQLVKA